MHGTVALFLFYLQAQPVGAEKGHFNAGEKPHQQKGKDKKDDRIPLNHAVKIKKGSG